MLLREINSCETKPTRSSQSFYCLVTKLYVNDEITRFDGIDLIIVGQALRGILMKGEGGKNVGDEPERKIASKLGHL